MAIVHKFEKANLGKAPFRFVGLETNSDRAMLNRHCESNGQTFTTNHCTSCDYCATAIQDAYIIESADGKRFKVGCECVKKTGDKGLIDTVKRVANEIKTKQRHEKEAEKIAKVRDYIEARKEELANRQHPFAWAANRGLTMLDYCKWTMQNAGNAGKIQLGKLLGVIETRKAVG